MDPRGYSEPTDREMSDRMAARLGSWSRLAARFELPTQAEGTPLS